MSSPEVDAVVSRVLDVVDGTVINTSSWVGSMPNATLRVITDTIKSNIRLSMSEGDWTKHYQWVPRHVTIVGDIKRGMEDIPMSAKSRRLMLELIEKAQKPERDVSGAN